MQIPETMNEGDKRTNAGRGFVILHDFPSSEMDRAWRDCLRGVEFPAHYNSPKFFQEPYWAGKSPFAILAMDRGLVTGVLTGLHEGNQVISGLQSRPQICVDARADSRVALDGLARGLLAEAGSAKMITVYSWSWLALDTFRLFGFRPRQLEGNVILDLTKGSEALFKEFADDRRRNIRYAIQHGVEVYQAATTEDFLAYYDIYVDWCIKKGRDIFPLELEEKAFRLTTGNRRLFLARISGKIIAGNIFRFFPCGMFESARNNSLTEFMKFKPNDLLQWRGIEWACKEGLGRHSLGGSHFFLKRFGGTVVPICRYRLDRASFRYHDRLETALDGARTILHIFPKNIQKKVRRFLGKKYYVP
jgi:hypothetical protein